MPSKFIDVPADPAFVRRMASMGSRVVRVVERWSSGQVLRVVVSQDPTGPGGAMEDHVSVSCTSPRGPKRDEVQAALAAIGWIVDDCEISRQGTAVVHAYRRPSPIDQLTDAGVSSLLRTIAEELSGD